ncbi:MAG: efflux RND transporter periplasmic adaptor subunit [Pseudosphingobacterium sp.]|nr:efflux RND transporter periplasmic adaptor subunit [Pseudosphingobacterium sp.]
MRQKRNILLACAALSIILLTACKQSESTQPVKKNIEDAVFASGHIEQENQYTVSASVEGIILSVPVKEGDSVIKNQLIAGIKSDVQNNQLEDAKVVYNNAASNTSPNAPQLKQIQTQINQAQKQLALDKENYTRYKDLFAKKSVSQLDFEKAELQYHASQNNLLALQKNYNEAEDALKLNEQRSLVQVHTQKSVLSDYQLTTTLSGMVINVFKKQGELIRKGEAIAEIGSGAFIIKLFVSEDDIAKINIGQSVAVSINTYTGKTFPAKITKIYPAFDQTEQSYVLEAKFTQLPEKMFSGTQLQANIQTGNRSNVLVIPTPYVVKESYVKLENGEERKIVTGSKNSDWTEVVSGITEKDVIVKLEK